MQVGLTDFDEIQAGTDPNDSASLLKIPFLPGWAPAALATLLALLLLTRRRDA